MRVARSLLALACVTACANGGAAETDGGGSGVMHDALLVGIDGATCGTNMLPCNAIYVTKAGNDAAAGTKTAPMKTISAAITKAAASSPPWAVFVQGGVFTEQLSMRAAVSVYGGFDETWTRNPAIVTEVNAPSPAVVFDQIKTGTALDGLTIKSGDAVGLGVSSYAVVLTGSMAIELRDVTIEPGIGAAGIDGTDGAAGPTNANINGKNGTPGCENSSGFCSSCGQPTGGAGGTSSCGRTGGKGGNAGHGGGAGSTGGDGVGLPQSGAFGGPAGAGQNGTPGGVGADGLPGGPGSSGLAAGDVGVFNGAVYVGPNGDTGTAGGNGTGGGGGGGGGGGDDDCDSYGSSGGGGGAGGCGGSPGTGGRGGGGSFGVVAVDSQVTIKSSMVLANHGGVGGRGGRGGNGSVRGSPGAPGGYGGGSEQDDGGMGGPGGYGGAGGNGGHGGGGGGGPSAAVVCVGTANINIPQTTLMGGTGGAGGTSPGNAGATGVSTRAIGCAFF